MQKIARIPHPPIMIAGLGNPGDEFQYSPHNAGFNVVDMVAEKLSAQWEKEKDAYVAQVTASGKKIILAKPLSFMNKSGTVVARVQKFYRLKTENIWIVHDDVDIPLGSIKLVHNRSAAGHKGVASVIAALKTQNFTRFRVGIRTTRIPKSRPKELMVQIVTKPFVGDNRKKFHDALRKCADAVVLAIEQGVARAMNETNQK